MVLQRCIYICAYALSLWTEQFCETGPTALFRWPSLCRRHPADLQPSRYGVCDSRHGYYPNKHEIDPAKSLCRLTRFLDLLRQLFQTTGNCVGRPCKVRWNDIASIQFHQFFQVFKPPLLRNTHDFGSLLKIQDDSPQEDRHRENYNNDKPHFHNAPPKPARCRRYDPYLYAGNPVTRSPMMRVWILCVPS